MKNKNRIVSLLLVLLTFCVTYIGTRYEVKSYKDNEDFYYDLWMQERSNIKIRHIYVNVSKPPIEIIKKEPIYVNDLRFFPDLLALEQFLLDDNVSQKHYDPHNFTCLEFATELSKRGAEKGWMISVYVDFHHRDNSTRHAYVITRIPGKWVVIEPQTDKIVWTWD